MTSGMLPALLRRYPATLVSTVVVTITFILQWFLPLVPLFERDGAAIADGQWWRILTSFVVQGSGWGQYIFNTLGLVLVGGAVERTRGTAWWLAAALAAQVVTSLIVLAWDPATRDSGSSLVVSGLVGVLTVTRFVAPAGWAAAAAGYRVFFVTYLLALALGGPIAGAVIGSVVTGVTVSLLVRSRFATWSLTCVLVIVVACAIGLAVVRDAHGVAVLVGLVVALVVGLIPPRRRPE
ncbi:MAG: rhomboid family intramembrane serine protease [Microbacterium sp.]